MNNEQSPSPSDSPRKPPSLLLRSLFMLFWFTGLGALVNGFFFLCSDSAGGQIGDALARLVFGLGAVICSQLLRQRRQSVILFFTGAFVGAIVYLTLVWETFNMPASIIGMLLLLGLVVLWWQGELTE